LILPNDRALLLSDQEVTRILGYFLYNICNNTQRDDTVNPSQQHRTEKPSCLISPSQIIFIVSCDTTTSIMRLQTKFRSRSRQTSSLALTLAPRPNHQQSLVEPRHSYIPWRLRELPGTFSIAQRTGAGNLSPQPCSESLGSSIKRVHLYQFPVQIYEVKVRIRHYGETVPAPHAKKDMCI
jgi:hypothetical protein